MQWSLETEQRALEANNKRLYFLTYGQLWCVFPYTLENGCRVQSFGVGYRRTYANVDLHARI